MSRINQFLKNKKRDGDNGKRTHQTYENCVINCGSYNLSKDDTLELYNLINNELEKGNKVSMVEKFNAVCTLMIDLDFKYVDKFSDRQYTEDFLKELYSFICDKINEVFLLEDSDQLQMFVLEKDNIVNAPQKGYESKDGIHLIFPGIIHDIDKYKILIDTILESSDEYEQIVNDTCKSKPSNNIDTIFDRSIYTGNWFIYGCGKVDDPFTYKLTHIYRLTDDDNIVESSIDLYLNSPIELMKINSVQLNTEITVEYIGPDEILKKKPSNNNVNMTNNIGFNNIDLSNVDIDVIRNIKKIKTDEASMVKNMVNIFDINRAIDHTKWIEVGYCLHSISPSLFDTWVSFSKKCPEKFNMEYCIKQWKYMERTSSKEYTIGTVLHWARKDNPPDEKGKSKFNDIINASLYKHVLNCIVGDKDNKNSGGHHSDVSNLIKEYFKDQFVCAGLRDKSWYYFDDNCGKWKKSENGHHLFVKFDTEIVSLFMYWQTKWQREKELLDDDDPEDKEKKSNINTRIINISKLIINLKNVTYQKNIMSCCKHKFYDEKFMDKLNSNLQLLGLDNCVVDLRYEIINHNGEKNNIVQFREGRPDDYISLSTGYELPIKKEQLPLSLDKVNELLPRALDNYDILHNGLEDVIRKIIPFDEINEYTFRFLSSCLSGEVREEKFYFWTGSGSNGKSKIVELIEHAMGDYSKLMDVSYITTKRGNSAAASPELERIRYARFVWMSEPDKDDQVFVGKLKQITGGDKMSTRGLYKEASDFKPQFKIILMCNDLPKLANMDGGVARRIEVVDFPSKFVANPRPTPNNPHQYKMDLQLGTKLIQWNLLFLIKLLGYYRLYDEEGTKAPKSVTEKTQVYLIDNDIIKKWIEKDLVKCEEVKPFNNIYDSFVLWCENEGINHKKYPKGDIKKELEKIQEKTDYGLTYGDKPKDCAPNGTPNYPKFNYCSREDIDDD